MNTYNQLPAGNFDRLSIPQIGLRIIWACGQGLVIFGPRHLLVFGDPSTPQVRLNRFFGPRHSLVFLVIRPLQMQDLINFKIKAPVGFLGDLSISQAGLWIFMIKYPSVSFFIHPLRSQDFRIFVTRYPSVSLVICPPRRQDSINFKIKVPVDILGDSPCPQVGLRIFVSRYPSVSLVIHPACRQDLGFLGTIF